MLDLPPGITRVEDPGGRPALRLQHGASTALVALQGAQVLSWRTAHGEVLWWGSNAEFAPAKPVRGGVPLVFPWFGDHPTEKALPAHGFARNLAWRLAATRGQPEVELEVGDDAGTRAVWPHPFTLRLAVALSERLRLRLTVANTGTASFRFEQALHTYFAVGDVRTASVHGLEHVPCTEQAAAPEASWDRGAPLRFAAETDRVFQGTPDTIELHAPALRRAVTLHGTNARSAIVWNPWPAKAARLSGLAADDWSRFCCIETANVREHAIVLAPGASHTLSLELACRPA
jgi:D-hexose-6-phosphate mutarotase